MDAVEFFKTARRLCKNRQCRECPVCKDGMCMVKRMAVLDDTSVENIEEIEKTVSKVEQWGKDNPINTRQSEFLRMFPNAPIDKSNGVLFVDPCTIDSTQKGNKYCSISCTTCRKNYWLAELANND